MRRTDTCRKIGVASILGLLFSFTNTNICNAQGMERPAPHRQDASDRPRMVTPPPGSYRGTAAQRQRAAEADRRFVERMNQTPVPINGTASVTPIPPRPYIQPAPAVLPLNSPTRLSPEDCADRAVILHRQYLLEHPQVNQERLASQRAIQRNLADRTAAALERIVGSFSPDDRRAIRAQVRGNNPAPRVVYETLIANAGRVIIRDEDRANIRRTSNGALPLSLQVNTFDCDSFPDPENHRLRINAHSNPLCGPLPTSLLLSTSIFDIRSRTTARFVNNVQAELEHEDQSYSRLMAGLTEGQVRTAYQEVMDNAYLPIRGFKSADDHVESNRPQYATAEMNSSIPVNCGHIDTAEPAPFVFGIGHSVDPGPLVEGNISCKFDRMIANLNLSENHFSDFVDTLGTSLRDRRARSEITPEQFSTADQEMLTRVRTALDNRSDRSLRALRETRDLFRWFFRFAERHETEVNAIKRTELPADGNVANLTREQSASQFLRSDTYGSFRDLMDAWFILDEGTEHNDHRNMQTFLREERANLQRLHEQRRNEIMSRQEAINQSYFEVCSHQYEQARQRGDILVCGRIGLQDIAQGSHPSARMLFDHAARVSGTMEEDFVVQGLSAVGCSPSAIPLSPGIPANNGSPVGNGAH